MVASKRQSLHNAFSVRANLKLAPHFIQFADEFAFSRNGCALRIVHVHAHFASLLLSSDSAWERHDERQKRNCCTLQHQVPSLIVPSGHAKMPAECRESENERMEISVHAPGDSET